MIFSLSDCFLTLLTVYTYAFDAFWPEFVFYVNLATNFHYFLSLLDEYIPIISFLP
jgi:hypothetical protein